MLKHETGEQSQQKDATQNQISPLDFLSIHIDIKSLYTSLNGLHSSLYTYMMMNLACHGDASYSSSVFSNHATSRTEFLDSDISQGYIDTDVQCDDVARDSYVGSHGCKMIYT